MWHMRNVPLLVLLLTTPVLHPAGATTFDCVINPSVRLKIGSPISTTLRSIEVERGDRVTAGQVIARLEAAVERADVALGAERAANTADMSSRAARVDFARLEAERGEKLLVDNNASRQKVEELRTQLRVAQGDMQIAMLNHHLAELDLARSRAQEELRVIRSPIDGVVVQRYLGPGEFVHQDAQIAEVATIDPLFVEAYPSARYFAAIKVGAVAEVKPDLAGEAARPAVITIVDPVFDAARGTFGVRLRLPNPGEALPAGLRCQVSIDTGEAVVR